MPQRICSRIKGFQGQISKFWSNSLGEAILDLAKKISFFFFSEGTLIVLIC